jgi:hypothetical protein
MKYEYMFPSFIIPGPDHLESCINVMLKPLIEDLKQLRQGADGHIRMGQRMVRLRVQLLYTFLFSYD